LKTLVKSSIERGISGFLFKPSVHLTIHFLPTISKGKPFSINLANNTLGELSKFPFFCYRKKRQLWRLPTQAPPLPKNNPYEDFVHLNDAR